LLLQKVLPAIAAEARVFHAEADEAREVDSYMAKLREHRRALKRERREKEQAAQVAPVSTLSV
jgi:predicted N-acyltransferase